MVTKASARAFRNPKRIQPEVPELVAQSLEALEKEVGGRNALVAALSHAPKSRDYVLILGLIGDPCESTTPLATLCARGGVTVGELIDAYKAGEINRAQAVSTAKVGAKLADVAEDTMRMALPRAQLCMACSGVGGACPACGGTGQITVEGDLEHKKLALGMGKLLQKEGGGINLQVSQQMGVAIGSAGGSLERLQAATDQILYGDVDVVEAPVEGEVVEANSAEIEGDWREDPPL